MRLIKVDRKGDINILLSPRIAYQRETWHITNYSAINMRRNCKSFRRTVSASFWFLILFTTERHSFASLILLFTMTKLKMLPGVRVVLRQWL